MNIVALSDLHGFLPDNVPACDLLLIAGDICPVENHAPLFHAQWLDGPFRFWLRRQSARKIIGIAGNHDLLFEQQPHLVPRNLSWTYLQDSGTQFEGWNIWGTPWQPWFFDWAFNGDPERLRRQWSLIPDETDILVVHGPPFGYGDGVPEGRPLTPDPSPPQGRGENLPDGVVSPLPEGEGSGMRGHPVRHCGCPHLLERILRIKPRLVVFGHIHEGRGVWQLGDTTLANVTLLDENYEPVYAPWVWEGEKK